MKLLISSLVLLLLPVPAILIYIFTGSLYWEGLDNYSLASLFGIAAFTWFSVQLPLAAKSLGLDKALGTPARMRLHGIAALLGLTAVHGHFFLKSSVPGFAPSLQTFPGFLAMNIFLWMSVLAVLFLGNHFPAPAKKLKSLRDWIKDHWKWTYKGARAVHGITVIAAVLMGIHVLLANSTSYSWITTTYMAVWLGLCLLAYLVYRIKNRGGSST